MSTTKIRTRQRRRDMDASRGSSNRGRHRSTRLRRLVCATACAAMAATAMAAPAGAYLTNFEEVRLNTPRSSLTFGGRSFQCPGGKFLIGVGGGVPWGSATWSGLGLNKLWIRSLTGGVGEVGGVETDPVAALWGVQAHGYCASFTTTPQSGNPGAAYIKEIEVVANRSPRDRTKFKGVTAGCLGRDAIGGGFWVIGPDGPPAYPTARHVTVHGSLLIDGDNVNGYAASAQETDFRFLASWQLVAYAICANRSLGTGGGYVGNALTERVGTTIPATVSEALALADCPQGKRAIGGSAEVLGATDADPPPREVVLTASYPHAGGWAVIAVEEDPTDARWRVRARAVCAQLVPHS